MCRLRQESHQRLVAVPFLPHHLHEPIPTTARTENVFRQDPGGKRLTCFVSPCDRQSASERGRMTDATPRPLPLPKPSCHVCGKTLSSYTGYWCRDCWIDRIRRPTPYLKTGTLIRRFGHVKITRPFYGAPKITVTYFEKKAWDEGIQTVINQLLPPRASQMIFPDEQRVVLVGRIRDIDYLAVIAAMALHDPSRLVQPAELHSALVGASKDDYRVTLLERFHEAI